MRLAIPTLDRKLLRDLWRIKGQGLAISAVIAAGIALFVMSDGMLSSLRDTMDAYYARYRFADVFAPVKRAPEGLLADIRRLPGVSRATGRVRGAALVDIEGAPAPISGEVVSLAANDKARLNDVHIVSGRFSFSNPSRARTASSPATGFPRPSMARSATSTSPASRSRPNMSTRSRPANSCRTTHALRRSGWGAMRRKRRSTSTAPSTRRC
jgi:hypothetical protein